MPKTPQKYLDRAREKYASDSAHREAVRERARLWSAENAGRKRATNQVWYQNNRDRILAGKIARQFGLTPEQYHQLLQDQGGVCAVCGKEDVGVRNGKRKGLAVDHDHATGEVRGLLCHHCNTGIGNLRDSPDLLDQAAAYLRSHQVVPANRN